MIRLFPILAVLNLTALLVTFVIGMLSKFVDHNLYIDHFSWGLFTAIGTLAIHCIIFIYFLGTGRWVKEVSLAYELPDEGFYKPTRELKRKSFPPALFAMLIVIAASAAGQGVQMRVWSWLVHFSLAIITLLINIWAYFVEYRCVSANVKVIDSVLVEVDRIRAERGLVSNAEALRQEKEAQQNMRVQ